jgi:hypothetical protein
MHRSTPDLVAVVALSRFAYEFDKSHPHLAAEAWALAVDRAAEYGLTPSQAEAVLRW